VLGRLAVDLSCQGRGLGEALLMDAIRRTLRASEAMAVHAVVVDAKHERAQTRYERYGFRAGFFFRSKRSRSCNCRFSGRSRTTPTSIRFRQPDCRSVVRKAIEQAGAAGASVSLAIMASGLEALGRSIL
jgi:hypothetical protein